MRLETEVLNNFGSYTKHFDKRAFAAVNDGLLPLYRRLLYASSIIGLDKGHFVKAARIVGDVIGNYHPHSDAAIYSGLVQLSANEEIRHMLVPMFEAQGNIGNPYSFIESCRNAAAMRYVEMRLSEYASTQMLDREYLALVPTFKNFDGRLDEPRYLPAKLPNVLINGAFGIGGIYRSLVPSFGMEAVQKLLHWFLQNQDATDEAIAKRFAKMPYLYRYGGTGTITAEDALSENFTLTLSSPFEENVKRASLVFYGLAGMTSTLDRALRKIYALDGTKGVTDNCDPHNGVQMKVEVQMAPDCDNPEKWKRAVVSAFQENVTVSPRLYQRNVVHTLSLVGILRAWTTYRLSIESKVLQARRLDLAASLEREELKLLVTTPAVLKELPKLFSMEAEAQVSFIQHITGVTAEQAKYVLGLSFSQLTRANQESIKNAKNELQTRIGKTDRLLFDVAGTVAKSL
jgi:DNA gyrase/topoisomerase IV subunit A